MSAGNGGARQLEVSGWDVGRWMPRLAQRRGCQSGTGRGFPRTEAFVALVADPSSEQLVLE